MEWTKIPTDLIQSCVSDKDILAIVKYQMIWAMLEREPTKEICMRYMTTTQYCRAIGYASSIQCRANADIKSVENHRNRQKLFYQKNQELKEKPDGHTDGKSDGHTDDPDKIRLDKNIYNIPPLPPITEKFNQFWENYKPVPGKDGTKVAKGSKSKCFEKFTKITKKDNPKKIIDGLKKYLDYCEKNRLCSCGAEVFLNQRRWENEYETDNTEQEGKEFWEWMKKQKEKGEQNDATI